MAITQTQEQRLHESARGLFENLDAEMGALGSAMLCPNAHEYVATTLRPEHYCRPAHRTIHEAVAALHRQGKECDLVTVKNELTERGKLKAAGDTDYLIHVVDSVVTPANVAHYCGIVKRLWSRREIRDRSVTMARASGNPDVDLADLIAKAQGLSAGLDAGGPSLIHVGDVDVSKDHRAGVATGFPLLDRMLRNTKGLPAGRVTIIGAGTGRGKTIMGTQLALNAAFEGLSVGYATYEVPNDELKRRMIAMQCGLWNPPSNPDVVPYADAGGCSWREAVDRLAFADILFWDPDHSGADDYSVEEFAERVYLQQQASPRDVWIIDYIQMLSSRKVRGGPESERIVMQQVARSLHRLARDTGLPIVALSQMAGENFHGSGDIERASGLALIIDREPNQTDGELKIRKSTYGPSGVYFRLRYVRELVKFEVLKPE